MLQLTDMMGFETATTMVFHSLTLDSTLKSLTATSYVRGFATPVRYLEEILESAQDRVANSLEGTKWQPLGAQKTNIIPTCRILPQSKQKELTRAT